MTQSPEPEFDPGRMLEGKVMVITGAGRGIGREAALLAARQRAKVVVNDLGGSPSGEGASSDPAQEVVDEINAAGGEAVVSIDTVADPAGAEGIIQTALDAFGRIDVVVNNAGILRDAIFHKLSLEDFDAVINVHLRGSFLVSRAAAPYFRQQESGAFIHFTSTSGLIGNTGQANYGAAKLGIVGLSKIIALDMARFNVRSNCIAPFAWSRLIGTIPDDSDYNRYRLELMKQMTPDKIAPMVVFLGSDAAREVTGQIFAVRKNEVFLFSQPRPIRQMHRAAGWTPESLATDMLPAFRSSFYNLDRTPDVFAWDAI